MNAPRPLVVAILFLAVCSFASAETAEYIRSEYRGEFAGREIRIVFLRPADAALAREYPAELQVFGAGSQETVDVDLQDGAYSDGYMEYRFSRDGLIMAETGYEYHLDRLGEPSESVAGVYEMRVNEASMEPDPEGTMLVTVSFREAGGGFEAEMISWSSAFTFRLVAGPPAPDVTASASPDAVTYVSADGGDVTVSVADRMIIVDDIEGEVVGLPFDAEYRTFRRLPPPPPEPTMLAAGLSPEEYYRQVYGRDMPGPIDFDTAAKTVQAMARHLPGPATRGARATAYLLSWPPLRS